MFASSANSVTSSVVVLWSPETKIVVGGIADAARGEAGADGFFVEDRARGPCIHVAGLAAARTAVEAGGVGVVLGLGAVTDEQDDAREGLREPDRPEKPLGEASGRARRS